MYLMPFEHWVLVTDLLLIRMTCCAAGQCAVHATASTRGECHAYTSLFQWR